jgi:hypothetical protein
MKDSLFEPVLGINRVITLSVNRAFGNDLLGCLVLLNNKTLNLVAPSKAGFCIVCGPGSFAGAIDSTLSGTEALIVSVAGGVFRFADQPDLTNLLAHLNDEENPHGVTKAQVGLGDVDNTADSTKPVSVAQAAAIAEALATAIQRANHAGSQPISSVSGLAEKLQELEEAVPEIAPDHQHGILNSVGLMDELLARIEIPVGITIGGVLLPNAAGPLISAPLPGGGSVYPGDKAWSTDGKESAPFSGNWVMLLRSNAVLGVTGTLEELAPPAGYVAGATFGSNASRIVVSDMDFSQLAAGESSRFYYLKTNPGGDPFWVDSSDPASESKNGTVIPAGRLILSQKSPVLPFSGGKLAKWAQGPDIEYCWRLYYFTNQSLVASWVGRGKTVNSISAWVPLDGATGTPTVAVVVRRLILPEYVSDSAAISGGLGIGQLYFSGSAVKSVMPPLLQRTALQGAPISATGVDALVVSGLNFDPVIVNPLARLDTFLFRPRYGVLGAAATSVYWTGSMWVLHSHGKIWTASENVMAPELVKLWSPSSGGAAGNPTVESLVRGTSGLLGQRCHYNSVIYECIAEYPARWVSFLVQGT